MRSGFVAIGRSPLLIVAGLAPQSLGAIGRKLGPVERFLPGQRVFSTLMVAAGAWLILESGVLPTI